MPFSCAVASIVRKLNDLEVQTIHLHTLNIQNAKHELPMDSLAL